MTNIIVLVEEAREQIGDKEDIAEEADLIRVVRIETRENLIRAVLIKIKTGEESNLHQVIGEEGITILIRTNLIMIEANHRIEEVFQGKEADEEGAVDQEDIIVILKTLTSVMEITEDTHRVEVQSMPWSTILRHGLD